MSVELRQLAALVALEAEGTFTDAAVRLGVSQAAVSRTIQALEAAVGVELVQRTTRSLALTEAGAELVTTAKRILDDLDSVTARLRGEPRSIRLGYAWAALGEHTTPMLRAWRRARPEQPIRMVHAVRRDVGLRDGTADLAIVRHELEPGEFEWARIGDEPRVCAMAVDHPLAERREIDLADLVGTRIGVDIATGTTSARLWLDEGLEPPEIVPMQDNDEWLDRLAEGSILGVSPIASAHYTPRPGVMFLPMPRAPRLELRLAWARRRRPAETDAVLAHLRGYYTGRRPRSDVGSRA